MAIQEVSSSADKQLPPGVKLAVNWWQWYRQLTGMDVIDVAKQQVMTVQDELFECQNKRRKLSEDSLTINEKLKEIYNEMVQTKRDDPKFVQLTILENKGLQEQSKVARMLSCLESEERDHFTRLATAIKEYQDSQSLNAMKYKYLSILVSTILALLSLTGSIIYNNKRISEIRNAVTLSQTELEKSLSTQVVKILDTINEQSELIKAESKQINLLNKANSPFGSGASSFSNMPQEIYDSYNNNASDFPAKEMEKIKQTGYYLGIGLISCYLLQQIFRT